MFEGFIQQKIQTSETMINLVKAGNGPPVLLLHGYPQTHVCWHRIAPRLAKHFTVVCSDLRGYGDSAKPFGDPKHLSYSKRRMAQDQVEVMHQLGFEEFAVVGHDRGGRVAQRMALDYHKKISRLVLLDIVPTITIYSNLNQERAASVWRYFFLIQPYDLPEKLIEASPEFYLRWTIEHWSHTPNAIIPEAFAEYLRCFDIDTIHAGCEDYRAGASIDLLHDSANTGEKIKCPLLVLWSGISLGKLFDVRSIWKEFAQDVQGRMLTCGHFLAEEQPHETVEEIIEFLRK